MKKLALLVFFFALFNAVSAQLFNPNDWNKTSLNDFGFYHIYISKYNQNIQLSWDNLKYPWNSPDKKWSNVFLPWGNVGIGTLTPAEKLHVLGNAKIEGSIYTYKVLVDSLTAEFLTVNKDIRVHRNIVLDGSMGIGVLNPTQKLDIAGNLKVSNSILTDSLIANGIRSGKGVFSTLNISNVFYVSGNTGLGVSNPSERLEVSGNVKVTNSIFTDSVISVGIRSGMGQFSNFSVSNIMFVSGKLGIGVSNPSEKLEVDGNIKASNSIIADSSITRASKSFSGDFVNMNIGNGLFVTGNTGIGVLSPAERLEVDGNIKSTKNVIASAIFSDTATLAKGLKVNGDISTTTIYTDAIRINGTPNLSIDNDVVFGGNAVMNQSLSIGTDIIPTGYSLSVKGKIIAEEIKVRHFDTWPDYVFNKDYKLKNLYEVEKYINQHQHLEGVPSAQQVNTEGVEVGEMQTKLLEKIEELTLYLIELKKQNDQLTEKVTQLEKQISR